MWPIRESSARQGGGGRVQYQQQQVFFLLAKQDLSYIYPILGPEPAFSRLGLVGLSGGYTYHRHTSHASPRLASVALGSVELCKNDLTKGSPTVILYWFKGALPE